MSGFAKTASVVVFLLLSWFTPRDVLADPHTEALVKEGEQKAAADYEAMNYTGAAAALKKAIQACGAKNCSPQTKAALLRDLGTMEFRSGDKDAAGKYWNDALAIDETLGINPAYDAWDVGAAWEDARAAAGLPAGPISSKPNPAGVPPPSAAAPAPAAPPPAPTHAAPPPEPPPVHVAPSPPPGPPPEQPNGGDFDHDPAIEQKEDTPLPIHVEYTGNSKLAQVIVKYKGAQMREWARVELKSVGPAVYEGLIPCADVTRGMMRYWIQGFDSTGDPAAATGDPKHPFSVAIRDKITSEPPRLPGKQPPRSCEESDCPPGLPGCTKRGAGGPPEEGGAEETEVKEKKTPVRAGPGYRRIWFGVSLAVDFLVLPGSSDVCSRSDMTGSPTNSQGYYCYDPVGKADFPANMAQNDTLVPKESGTATGALQGGDIRILFAFDYAVNPSVLVGGRFGYVANTYPGKSAVDQGHAFFAPLHIEARATYLFGVAPLTHVGFAPMAFGGLGLSQFDGHQSTAVRLTTNPPTQTVDAWLTDAPFFVVLGGGGRYQFSERAALTGALRLNVVIGGNGLMTTFGPEIGVLYGF
jgi:hypothetical protein